MGGRVCKTVLILFLALYVLALGLLAVGTFGLFGAEKDPLAAVFLVPLGMPWVFLVDRAPEALGPWLATGAPAVNLGIITAICRARNRNRG